MRIALVSPYSWSYPGGVTRHIEALAEQYLAVGHDVRVLAPYDPPDRLAARMHRGARPAAHELPEWLIPLGRTVGFAFNGAVSNLAHTPYGVSTLRRELRGGGYDVVHLHEPVAPAPCWDALCSIDKPLVGTFHCYSENALSNGVANLVGARRRLNRLHVRIAVSEAAAWTGRRFFGGSYRVIPNGVHVPAVSAARRDRGPDEPLRIAFIGQAVERKGLPVLLRAFEALREHMPVELHVVGVGPEEIAPLMLDDRDVHALGKCSDEDKRRVLERADMLCAPSLGGESFGMVLTEAFAAGTPVVASDIAGYRDVVRDGIDGVLVPRGDASRLAEVLRDLALDHRRRDALAGAAAVSAQRYAWPRVAAEVLGAYEDAIAMPAPEGARARAAAKIGLAPADGVRIPAVRLPTLEPLPQDIGGAPHRGARLVRRGAIGVATLLAVALSVFGLQRIGIERIGESLLAATPTWVLLGLGLMCFSMVLRGVAWHAILRAALPRARVRFVDALQGTFIGVLMSATLPARLGEPARAFVVARRTGNPREHMPVVLGTIISQTLLNVLALVVLGVVMFSTVDVFKHHSALLLVAVAPLLIVVSLVAAPALLRSGTTSRFSRVAALVGQARRALVQVRAGLRVFSRLRLGGVAAFAQLTAWAVQWLSCYVLLVALGLDDRAGLAAAAAVLFAVNVTAVLPATPSNLGVFQAACVAVLTAYGVGAADALAYGIILQAVEIATAIAMGTPALVKEGLSWREVRLRAMHASPVELAPAQGFGRTSGASETA